MMNLEQFAHIAIMRLAIDFAKRNNNFQGPNFTWLASFPIMAISHVETQWWMSARSKKVLAANKEKIKKIALEIAKDFSEITGQP